jgi:GNAT superfamily N-acetyltransferase
MRWETPMQNPLTIRRANEGDADEILRLIQCLAEYEKEPEAVKASQADILRDGFGERPVFQTLIAEIDGQVHGFALYFFTWSSWEGRSTLYLEDLFVEPVARGRGLGARLFKELAHIAVQKSCARFEWSVLDWNELARKFYHKLGAKHMQGWLPYRLDGQALKELARL